jgi:hypothetical protein
VDAHQVDQLLNSVPPKERQRLSEQRVRDVAASLTGDIRAISYAITLPANLQSQSQVCSGTALVLADKLVLLESDGGAITVNYADIQRVNVEGGTKKLFGGYNRVQMWITSRNGEVVEWSMGNGGEWGLQVAKAVQRAHEGFVVGQGL